MNRRKSHHRIVRMLFFFALNLVIVPNIFTVQGQLKFKKCDPQPLPLQLAEFDNQPQQIDSLCGNKGCFKGAANNKQNEAKNNFCAPTTNIIPVTRETFKALQNAVNKIPTIKPRVPPASRAKLKNIQLPDGSKLGEGKVVSFVGFVLSANHSNVNTTKPLTTGNGESVQCNFLGCAYNDIHVELAGDQNDTKPCDKVTAEIIPHYRPAAWNKFDSPDYQEFLRQHPVRLKGQLFYDGSHIACKNGKPGVFFEKGKKKSDMPRIAVWEIHPVYSIEVCKKTGKSQCINDETEWIPFTNLQSFLGLTTVKSTKKCEETTTNPKSPCQVKQ
jgi:hypothetical protein